jgi:predicted dienelactone hydrolase
MIRKIAIPALFCLVGVLFDFYSSEAHPPKIVVHKVGLMRKSFIPPEPYNWRGAKTHALITDIWYPADTSAVEQTQYVGDPTNPFAIAGKAAPDDPILGTPAKFPLILLSHGTGGSSQIMAWFGTGLAARGFIVAAVNHPGNNTLEDYEIPGFALWWERATDLRVVLDQMLADSTFAGHIDSKRIGAAGFSLGGFTVIEIAGGIGELPRYREYCKAHKSDGICSDPPEFPGLIAKIDALVASDPAMQAAVANGAKSHRDARVRAIFAMAPAIGPAFSTESLASISIPAQIVAGSADTAVPLDSSAKFFAAHIHNAQLTIIQAVGHYTFLDTCGELGRSRHPDICLDQAGILRDDTHAQVVNLAAQFLDANLK